jgi:hypothetical protein
MKAKLNKVENGWVLTVDNTIYATDENSKELVYKKLSLKNCQAIERGYDLDELAKENYHKFWSVVDESEMLDHTFGYVEGFQKALELMGDKKFSKEDVEKAIEFGHKTYHSWKDRNEEKFIQSLQQTEWDVEIVMEPYHDGDFIGDGKTHVFEAKWKPTLDADGCLILKRI